MLVIALGLLTSCSGVSEEVTGGNQGSGSCALRARLDGRWYSASGGIVVIPTYGELLGSAVIPPCGAEDAFRIAAVRIVGVSPEIAFASPKYEDAVFLADSIDSFPTELRRLREEPRCARADAPIVLGGQWLGIIEPG